MVNEAECVSGKGDVIYIVYIEADDCSALVFFIMDYLNVIHNE